MLTHPVDGPIKDDHKEIKLQKSTKKVDKTLGKMDLKHVCLFVCVLRPFNSEVI